MIDALRRGSEILEKGGLTMVLEPLSDTPDLFLRNSDQTYMICRAVNSPSCKILFDIYHMQKNEGMIIPNIDLCWDEIAYVQIRRQSGQEGTWHRGDQLQEHFQASPQERLQRCDGYGAWQSTPWQRR